MINSLSCVCGNKSWLPSSISPRLATFDLLNPLGEAGLPYKSTAAELKVGESGHASHPAVKQVAEMRLGATKELSAFPCSQDIWQFIKKARVVHASRISVWKLPPNWREIGPQRRHFKLYDS
jgi:hypothetical protein